VPVRPVEIPDQAEGGREGPGPRPLLVGGVDRGQPAGQRVGHDVPVARPEERRPEGGHQGELIRRVVDRPENRQRLVNLLSVEERLAPLHGEAQARGLERLLEEAHLGEPAGQDHRVPGPARASVAGGGVADLAGPAGHLGQEDGEGPRLGPQEVVAGGRRGGGETQGDHRGLLREPRGRGDGLVGGLVGLVGRLDQLGEDPVHEAQDGRSRAEVLGQVKHRAVVHRPGLVRQLTEETNLGSTETVDRLLGVTHHHQGPGPTPGQETRDLDLEGIGVLELVDDEVAEALLEVLPHRRSVAQRVPGLDQEVQEVEDAALGLEAFVPRRDPGERSHQAAVEIGPEGRPPLLGRLLRPGRDGPGLLQGLGARPPWSVAEVLRHRRR
jgi:hypothetical protein